MSTHDESAAKCKARRPVNYKTTERHICITPGGHDVHRCTCGTMWAGEASRDSETK